jgi:outer membrane immunogenic protein
LVAVFIAAPLTVANAADMAVKSPPPQPAVVAANWSGWYMGVNVGGAWDTNTNASVENINGFGAIIFPGISVSPKPSGAIGGGQLGYNWQVANWLLLGIEADIDASGFKGSATTGSQVIPGFPNITTVQQQNNWLGTVRGRLGLLPTSNLLFYGTYGFAYGQTELNFNSVNTGLACPLLCENDNFSSMREGWSAGGGFEYLFLSHWTARVEYLYVDLGTQFFGPTPANLFIGSVTLRENIVRAGLNYKF